MGPQGQTVRYRRYPFRPLLRPLLVTRLLMRLPMRLAYARSSDSSTARHVCFVWVRASIFTGPGARAMAKIEFLDRHTTKGRVEMCTACSDHNHAVVVDNLSFL